MSLDRALLDEILEGTKKRYFEGYHQAEQALSTCHRIGFELTADAPENLRAQINDIPDASVTSDTQS